MDTLDMFVPTDYTNVVVSSQDCNLAILADDNTTSIFLETTTIRVPMDDQGVTV
jgi:hypothetical protein